MVALSPQRGHRNELPASRFSSPLVAVLIILPISTLTQLTFGDPPVTTIPSQSTRLLSSQSQTPSPTPYQPLTTSFSTTDTDTDTDTDDSDTDDLAPSNVVNYAFLLLAVLVAVLLALLWTFHRRRKRKRALSRHGGHDALAQDLEGWRGNRSWAVYSGGRGWRNVFGGHGPRREGRMGDGLDEGGEAPPPYDYLPEAPRSAQGRSGGSDWPERTLGDGRNTVRTPVPLHVLNESGEEGKPPEYDSYRRA